MNRLGIQSLNAGAPDLRLSGDQTQRGTYTQRRRDQMAYGGIAGLDGRKKYGIGSWFQEEIMDRIKDNPVTSAVVGGGLLNQFGLPDIVTRNIGLGENVGQNWLGNLLGNVVPGDTQFDTVIGNQLPFMYPGYEAPTGAMGDVFTIGGGIGGAVNTLDPNWQEILKQQAASKIPGADRIIDMMRRKDPTNVAYEDARPAWQKALDTVQRVVTGGPEITADPKQDNIQLDGKNL